MAILFCAFMRTATLWYIQEFGFNPNAATTLYDMQMLKDAKTLSELEDDAVANI